MQTPSHRSGLAGPEGLKMKTVEAKAERRGRRGGLEAMVNLVLILEETGNNGIIVWM